MKVKEQSVVTCKPHWISMVPVGFFAIMFFFGGFSYLFDGMFNDFLISLTIAAVLIVVMFIQSKSSSLVLTESAVVGKVGIIRTKKLASPISKIQDISVSSGLLGKLFRYSTVVVSTAGSSGAEYVFKRVTNGNELQEEFLTRAK